MDEDDAIDSSKEERWCDGGVISIDPVSTERPVIMVGWAAAATGRWERDKVELRSARSAQSSGRRTTLSRSLSRSLFVFRVFLALSLRVSMLID